MSKLTVVVIDDYGNEKIYTRNDVIADVEGLQRFYVPCDGCDRIVLRGNMNLDTCVCKDCV